MKAISIVLSIVFAALASNAATIKAGRLDSTGKNLLLDVSYSGGCGKHNFSLSLNGCAESLPVQCSAKLIHETNDFCEALISKTITLNLAENGIKGSYFSNGSLTVESELAGLLGDDSVTVFLPEMTDEKASTNDEANVSCTTHTGSTLTISPEAQTVQIDTTAGEQLNYLIVKTDVLFLESFPVQIQSKYSLDDGRKVVTTFTSGSLSGRGHYVRIGGQASPSFDCVKD